MNSINLKNKDIISIDNLSKEEILRILELAERLKREKHPTLLNGYLMASCFFEPSTRTRLSFESAMNRLGGKVIGFADGNVTSSKKGEDIHDTIKIVGGYADIIVIRHPKEGSAKEASEATNKPVINGGDGRNQHPTQTLLDLFTIKECQNNLEGLNIAIAGDLKNGRAVHSLAKALTHFNSRLYFVSHKELQMPESITDELLKKQVVFSFHETIDSIIDKIDILYVTRIQKERFENQEEYERLKDSFILTPSILKQAKNNLKILHTLPRINEVSKSVDHTPHAYYFQQAENGLYVRQALLGLILGGLN